MPVTHKKKGDSNVKSDANFTSFRIKLDDSSALALSSLLHGDVGF